MDYQEQARLTGTRATVAQKLEGVAEQLDSIEKMILTKASFFMRGDTPVAAYPNSTQPAPDTATAFEHTVNTIYLALERLRQTVSRIDC